MRAPTRIALPLVLTLAVGLGTAPAAGLAAGAAAKPKAAGTVTELAGSKNLKRSGHRLARGATLRVGDRLVMGAGVSATLRLDRPGGVSADADLVELVDAPGTSHTVATAREASGRVVVKIASAA